MEQRDQFKKLTEEYPLDLELGISLASSGRAVLVKYER